MTKKYIVILSSCLLMLCGCRENESSGIKQEDNIQSISESLSVNDYTSQADDEMFISDVVSEMDQTENTKSISEDELVKEYVIPVESNKIIGIDEATTDLRKKLDIIEEENMHLVCTRVEFYSVDEEMRCFYIFRRFEDYPDYRVTTGWYAVDIETGECFDTNVLTEWSALE